MKKVSILFAIVLFFSFTLSTSTAKINFTDLVRRLDSYSGDLADNAPQLPPALPPRRRAALPERLGRHGGAGDGAVLPYPAAPRRAVGSRRRRRHARSETPYRR